MATYRFFPPTRFEGPGVPLDWPHREAHRLYPYRLQGISLVKDSESGLFVEQRGLTEAIYANGTDGVDYFQGGRRYVGISQEVADLLTDSGYGDRLEQE